MISSSSNPRIKFLKSLAERREREKERKFVIEGIHLVSEALASQEKEKKFRLESVFFSKRASASKEGDALLKRLLKANVELVEVSEKVMTDVSDVEAPQGIVAVLPAVEDNIEDIVSVKVPLIVVCHGVQDPGNLGTIIRSADAFGASGILLGSGTVDVYNPKTLRSSMGSVFHLPIVVFDDVKVGLRRLKEKGVSLLATTLKAQALGKSDLVSSCAVVFGAEGAGLPEDVLKMCDRTAMIPMPGGAESLNVGVAASIVLYEAVRQRQEKENA